MRLRIGHINRSAITANKAPTTKVISSFPEYTVETVRQLFCDLVRIWYDPVNAYSETGGLAGCWTLNSSDEMAD